MPLSCHKTSVLSCTQIASSTRLEKEKLWSGIRSWPTDVPERPILLAFRNIKSLSLVSIYCGIRLWNMRCQNVIMIFNSACARRWQARRLSAKHLNAVQSNSYGSTLETATTIGSSYLRDLFEYWIEVSDRRGGRRSVKISNWRIVKRWLVVLNRHTKVLEL